MINKATYPAESYVNELKYPEKNFVGAKIN